MPRRLLLTSVALLLLALVAACGRRETAAPPAQGETPTTSEGPTFTPLTGDELLRATEQALSLMLTASPGSAEGYTAIALFQTTRATVQGDFPSGEQPVRTPTANPQEPQITVPPQPFTPAPPPPPTLTAVAAELWLYATEQALSLTLTANPASAEGYTAIALFETARTTVTAGAIPPEQRRPTVTPDPALPTPAPPETQPGSPTAPLRYYLPPDVVPRYVAANPQASDDAYYVALTPRGQEPGQGNTITLSGGRQAEATWRENQPGNTGAVIEPVTVRGVPATIASSGFGHTISWMEDGQAYAVSYAADGDEAEALGFVERLVAVDRGAWETQVWQAQQ